MKHILSVIAILLAAIPCKAQTFTEWLDAEVNEVNRAPIHSSFKIFDSEEQTQRAYRSSSEYTLSLNGKWAFHFAKNADDGHYVFISARGNMVLAIFSNFKNETRTIDTSINFERMGVDVCRFNITVLSGGKAEKVSAAPAELAIGSYVNIGLDTIITAVSCSYKGGTGIFSLYSAKSSVGYHFDVFKINLYCIHKSLLYMQYVIAASLLADSARLESTILSSTECPLSPSTPILSIVGIPAIVVYAASEPPGP